MGHVEAKTTFGFGGGNERVKRRRGQEDDWVNRTIGLKRV